MGSKRFVFKVQSLKKNQQSYIMCFKDGDLRERQKIFAHHVFFDRIILTKQTKILQLFRKHIDEKMSYRVR